MKTCKRGLHTYLASMTTCVECRRINARHRYATNPILRSATIAASAANYAANSEKVRRERTARYAANPDQQKSASAAYYAANAKVVNEKSKEYQSANSERLKIKARAWRESNAEKLAARNARRRANALRATPAWANAEKIAEYYHTANMLGMHTGEIYHVDHIVPLQSKLVCGLHWEGNLQILPARENLSKGNRLYDNG